MQIVVANNATDDFNKHLKKRLINEPLPPILIQMTQEIFRYARRTVQMRAERTRAYVSTDLRRATQQNGKLTSHYSMISVTTPEPTVLPPSRIANLSPSSIAIGVMSFTSMMMLSPGMHISVPSGSLRSPVTSVVLK